MDNPTTAQPPEKNLPRYGAIRLKPMYIAALYALLAFGNCLLYWQGSPLEVLGFTDDPIGWWAIVTVLFTIAFCVLAVKLAHQGRLHDVQNQQQHSHRQPTMVLVALVILFALPNVFIAFLHLNMGIPSGFLYWGEVRAAYEIPFFHLLPILLLLYWWLSSRRQDDGRIATTTTTSAMTIQKWGALASFLLAPAFIVPSLIYLTGNLRNASGRFAYDLADFLSGPVWAATLVMALLALRERMGECASRRMNLALLTALLAAGAMVSVAFIRSANRHYHLLHPELNLENSTLVLVVWTTLVAGMTATGWHCLGWSFVLLGSAGWTSRRLPRGLSLLYLAAGAIALFVYLLPEMEGGVMLLGVVVSLWQGILLWRSSWSGG